MFPTIEPARTMDEGRRALLVAVMDRLIPAHGELPGAGALGLISKVEEEAVIVPANGLALHQVLDKLPGDFLALDGDAQDAALKAVEADMPLVFFSLIVMTYNAYYTDGRVLAQLERLTGYAARPPQPQGYVMPEFDEAVLAKVKQREPFWRKA